MRRKEEMQSLMCRILLILSCYLFVNPALGQLADGELSQFQTSLPLRFDTGNRSPDGMPSTVITIQGKEIPLILDTGAKKAELSLSPYCLKDIKVNFTGKQECFKAFDGEHCHKEFIIPEVKVGDFIIKNVKGLLMPKLWSGNDEGFKETEASKNGVIGFALLSKFNLLLDYPNAKATLVKPGYKPTNYDVTNWIVTPFTGHLNTTLKINDKIVTLVWDTGAIPSGIKKSVVSEFKSVPCKNTPHSGEECLNIEPSSFTTMQGDELPHTWFRIQNIPQFAPFDGLVGSNFYKENLVYFDIDNHLIYIKHYNNAN